MKYFKNDLSPNSRVAQNLHIIIGGNRQSVCPEEIIFIEASSNYTHFYTRHEKFTTAFHLGFFEKSLEDKPQFIRISKSFIVNTQFLKNICWQASNKAIELYGGTRLTISRRKAKKVRESLNMLNTNSIINHI